MDPRSHVGSKPFKKDDAKDNSPAAACRLDEVGDAPLPRHGAPAEQDREQINTKETAEEIA